MVLSLLTATVFATFLLTWLFELRHKDEALPALSNRQLVRPFAVVLSATLLAIPIVLWPLASLSEWPRSTQVAWTAVQAADRASGYLDIGGAEHSAVLGWPNGNFWPEVRLVRDPRGVRLSTQGGSALIRVGDSYLDGDVLIRDGGAKQIGNQAERSFSVALARSCWVCKTELRIARTPVAAPLVIMRAPATHASRAHVLGALLVPSLNDLRRSGAADPAVIEALEEWANSVRVLRPTDNELRIIQDGETWHTSTLTLPSTIEIIWPRRKLVVRVEDADGAIRLSFDPPWTRSSPLPPIAGSESALLFASRRWEGMRFCYRSATAQRNIITTSRCNSRRTGCRASATEPMTRRRENRKGHDGCAAYKAAPYRTSSSQTAPCRVCVCRSSFPTPGRG